MDDDTTDDEMLGRMVLTITLDVRERLGDDADDARYQFFKRFVTLATEMTGRPEGEQGDRSN